MVGTPPDHRLAPIVNRRAGVVVIDDSYNANPEGAAAALRVLRDHPAVADAALVGRMAPLQPGSATFKFKTLDGITEAGFTTTEIEQLHDAGVITYVSKFGVLQTSEGFVTDKTYADIQLAKDWLKARMEERVSRVLFVNEKIPYDILSDVWTTVPMKKHD